MILYFMRDVFETAMARPGWQKKVFYEEKIISADFLLNFFCIYYLPQANLSGNEEIGELFGICVAT